MGKFIVFEGSDGVGKTTQIFKLARFLEKTKHSNILVTREPGGSQLGKKIRSLVLAEDSICPESEAFLYAADRAQHVQEIILPALQKGKTVISDRYTDSTIAYQVGGRGLGEAAIRLINDIATKYLKPDLTFLIDLDINTAHQRLKEREGAADRIELENIDFHDRVRRKFLDLVDLEPQRYCVLDGKDSSDSLNSRVLDRVMQIL